MAVVITVTPTEVQVGDQVTIDGKGFTPGAVVTITVPEEGFAIETVADVSGEVNSDDLADRAKATLTSDGTNVTAADTVTIGSVTYTFRAAVTTTANEVKIGADAATTLANLKSAVNLDGNTAVYGSLTVVNPDASAGAITATTLVLYAKTAGTGGNSLTSTEASTHLSFGGATFAGGAASTGVSPIFFTPQKASPFTVNMTDGTNTGSTRVQVWTE
jgi:hypothetical protein